MRIRSVHPGYWKDDVVVEDMGWAERGFFIAIWVLEPFDFYVVFPKVIQECDVSIVKVRCIRLA